MIGDDEYYMDDDDDEGGSSRLVLTDDSTDSEEDSGNKKTVSDELGGVISKTDKSIYTNSNISQAEVNMLSLYDNIRSAAAKNNGSVPWDQIVFDIVTNVLTANPTNTSKATILSGVKEALNSQGKARIVSTMYNPDGLMTGEEVDEEFLQTGTGSTSEGLSSDARNQISRFIDHLAKRDLSQDSLSAKKIKRRHIPALIIFLFSAGMYDLVIDCPTLPDLYKKEVDNAFKQITRVKLDIVERLARRYEEKNRPQVAECVRRLGIAWFEREPAEIKTLNMFDYLNITTEDVMTYKEFKSKFNNVSKAITQEAMSKLIAVYQEDGTFEILKDKTRQQAVDEVKELWKNWADSNPVDSELASKIIYRNI